MSDTLLQQALQLAQEGIEIFPVNADKRPALKGWRELATTDEKTLKDWFSGKWPGIGVPCGPDQNLICFDLDFGHTDDPERKAALSNWLERHIVERLAENGDALVRSTRSGGLHVIMNWPEDKPPRRIMPKLDVIIEGFYFVWNTDADDYKHVAGALPNEDSGWPPDDMLEVIEKGAGSDGSALMSSEEAHECMMSDGDEGQRHDALLRITQDWAQDHVGASLSDLCEGCADWLSDMYEDQIDPERFRQLAEWGIDERGHVSGELGRAMDGAFKLQPMSDELADAVVRKLKERGQKLPPAKHTEYERPGRTFKPFEGELFTSYVPGAVDETAPWLIPNLLRQRGNAGFTGMSGVGKTTITAAWVAGLISGRTDVVGLPGVDGPIGVAWLNAEEEAADLLQHAEVAMETHGLDAVAPLIVVGEEQLDNHEDGLSLVVKKFNTDLRTTELVVNEALVDKIVEEIKVAGVQVMIADPVTEFNDGNENDRGDAKKLNRAFKMIAQRAGVAVIYWAHTGQPAPSARPDWYRSDMYAQRGSSQNVGSLKTAGTVWHMYPSGLTAQQSWGWVRSAKDGEHPDIPNLVAVTVVKIKKSPTFFETAYELRPSVFDNDVPVVHPLSMESARLAVDAAANGSEALFSSNLSIELVNRLGEGAHDRGAVNKAMQGVTGWPKDLRADRAKGRQVLDTWARGTEVTMKGDIFSVRSEHEDKAAFTFHIRRVG